MTLWRFSFLWLDLWDNRYGVDFSFEGPKWSYSVAFGFGCGVRMRRSPS